MGGGIGSILYTERGSLREHFTYNAVGDTVALTRNNGNVKKTDLYEAFGNIESSTGASDNNRLANTKERSFALNLDNHGMRYYDPEVGRYLTRDPLGYGDGLNCYLYVHNNPINHIDPLGLAGEGFLYSWLAKKMEEGAQNTSSPALAATASLASEALHMGAGYDPQYTSYQTNQRVSQELQEHGVREAMGMELVRARTTVEESVGTSDIVRAVDSEGKYSVGERVWYGVQGASKTFLTVMGGMSLAGKSTPAVAAGEKPPPLPSPAAVEMAPEASAAAKGAAKPFAMGLDAELDAFAQARGATTWKQFPNPETWKSGVLDKLADPNTSVHFNLNGVDVWGGVQRASSGAGGATDWELLQLRQNPQFWDSTTFWKNGQVAPNPFK